MNLTFDTILPTIIGLITGLALLGFLLYNKGKEISIVRLLIWIIWIVALSGILGFVATKIDALPYSFLASLTGFMILGILYLVVAPYTLDWWQRANLTDVFLPGSMLLCFGAATFVLVFNLLATTPVSYFFVAFLAFFLPLFAAKSYDFWMQIPQKKYKTWSYPVHDPVPRLQPIDPIKLMMNFTPVPSSKNEVFESYEVEFPTNTPLSELFHYFISFHNKHREYRKKPIQYLEGNDPLEWILFKYSPQKKKLYLDMEKTLIENQVNPNENIYATSSI